MAGAFQVPNSSSTVAAACAPCPLSSARARGLTPWRVSLAGLACAHSSLALAASVCSHSARSLACVRSSVALSPTRPASRRRHDPPPHARIRVFDSQRSLAATPSRSLHTPAVASPQHACPSLLLGGRPAARAPSTVRRARSPAADLAHRPLEQGARGHAPLPVVSSFPHTHVRTYARTRRAARRRTRG